VDSISNNINGLVNGKGNICYPNLYLILEQSKKYNILEFSVIVKMLFCF
jgi:hypothetical protein